MEVGLLFTFRNPPPWRRDGAELYRSTLDEIVLAETLGVDGIWLAEHHFTDDGWSPSPLTLAAAVAARTERVRIGTFVLLLPQHDPVRVAEAATAIDLLSNGRLTLGVGIGYRADEERAVGLDPRSRGDRMDEALELLIRCLDGGQVDFNGRFYRTEGLEMSPRPAQSPRPPILTAGGGRRALERSVRLGCEGLAFHPPPEVYDQYVELLAQYGRRPEDQRFATIVLGYAAAEAAWSEVGPHATWIWDHYTQWLRAAGDSAIFSHDPQADFVIGDPEHWRRSIGAMLAANARVPCHHLVVELVMAGMSHQARVRGIEYFAAEVLPILQNLDPLAFVDGDR